MPYWRECPGCGAHLDPGEICEECKENAARGAANTQDGKAWKDLTTPSVPHGPEESKWEIYREILCVLRRNMEEEYLRKALTRLLILERLAHQRGCLS